MPGYITYSSGSALLDRVVRVERRRVLDDGMAGAVEEYSTIIPRYFVHIWEPKHQERRRRELGQTEVSHTRSAIGLPAINGRSIMIGDRFVDDKNNQIFDVLAVPRPHGGPYNAVRKFTLRLMEPTPEGVS